MLKKRREQSVSTYSFSHVIAQIALERMLEKFDWMRFDPKQILILGLSHGQEGRLVQERFKQAQIFLAELAFSRLQQDPTPCFKIQHSFDILPYRAEQFDCIIANCCFHHVADQETWLGTMLQLLKPGGLLLFSAYGPLTLSELQTAFAQLDSFPHAADFFDMHDLGDLMKKLHYDNPALDQEVLTLTYQHLRDLFKDLKESGETNLHPQRRRSLMTPRQLEVLDLAYEVFRNEAGRLEASVELIYGLGWKPSQARYNLNTRGEVSIPISSIKRRV